MSFAYPPSAFGNENQHQILLSHNLFTKEIFSPAYWVNSLRNKNIFNFAKWIIIFNFLNLIPAGRTFFFQKIND